MLSLVRATRPARIEWSRWYVLLAGMAVAALVAFLLLPGSIASKAHLALHGICAQRASHSLFLGEEALPMDARMTGIYLGAVVAVGWLMAAGAAMRARTPPRRVVIVLALFVAVMAADGFNALAFDLGLPHPYGPSNVLRLATGLLAGVALGVAVMFLLATTLGAGADRSRPVVGGISALAVPLGIASAVGGLALSGLPILYAPFAVGLLVAAVVVFTMLATIALALVSARDWAYGSLMQIGPSACVGLAAALALIVGLSGMRLALEVWFGLPKLT